jgi:hypothetical protein
MTTSEWISVLALSISSGGFALQARNWFMNGPRLHLSVIAEAISMPDDGKGERVALTVINRGTDPTMLTHMIAFIYGSPWQKFRDKPIQAGIVNSPEIPSKLDTNGVWMGMMAYNEKLTAARGKGQLYVGVISSHSNKKFFIHVPPPKKQDPNLKKKIASAS